MFKSIFLLAVTCMAAAGCSSDASVASRNLSQAADNFEISRRVVFYNGINGEYMLTIEGLCSLDADSNRKITITCKVGQGSYKKHFLGLSDNVTYFIEQMEPAPVGVYRYRVVFKPAAIIPDIQVKS